MDTPESLLASAREQIAGLTAAVESANATATANASRIADLEATLAATASAAEAMKAELATLSAEAAALRTEAKSAELRAAEIVAKVGVTEPVEIKPGSATAKSRDELLEEFHTERDPRKRAAIYAKIISA